MSDRPVARGLAAAAILTLTTLAVPAFATDAGTEAATKLVAASTTASITAASCERSHLRVSWDGGVAVVDYFSEGTPFLQARQDPAASQTSIDIVLAKEWNSRKLVVRLFDKSATLLDSRPVDCKPAS